MTDDDDDRRRQTTTDDDRRRRRTTDESVLEKLRCHSAGGANKMSDIIKSDENKSGMQVDCLYNQKRKPSKQVQLVNHANIVIFM